MRHPLFFFIVIALVIISLFAAILGANAQEEDQTGRIPVTCFPSDQGKTGLDKIGAIPGITIIELEGEDLQRFMTFLADAGHQLPPEDARTVIKAILIEVAESAGRGPARTNWVFIRQQEPSYCGSRGFMMPPNVAQAALRAIFGQKT